MSEFLEKTLKLQVNEQKVQSPGPGSVSSWGYSFTKHQVVRLKIAPSSVDRLKDKIRSLTTGNGSKSVAKVISELTPVLRGWISYFRLTEVKGVLEELDGWIRRKLRCLLWRQWKRPYTEPES
ncbi:group II intron maturase-specific domain-containing protein [Serratia marcescens]